MQSTLKTCFYKDPSTLDPRKCGDIISSAMIFFLFRGLTRMLPNGKIVFDLADSLEVSRDKKCYVFSLGEYYWSDGRLITALDFEKSWKRLLEPDFPSLSSHLFYPIKNAAAVKAGKKATTKIGIHTEGFKRLVVELEYPLPFFLELLSFCAFFPIPSHCESQFFPMKTKPFVSSGPFRLMHWYFQKEILLKRNHCLRHGTFPEEIQIRIIPDIKRAFFLFQKGKLDWVGEPFSPFPLNHLPAFSEDWESQAVGGITLCFFNTQLLPFSNQKLRLAFSHAIHRDKILQKLCTPNTSIATGLIPPLLKNRKRKDFFTDGDVETAQKYFREGMKELRASPKKFDWVLSFEACDRDFQIAKSLQKDWEEAFSIRVHLEPLEFKSLYDRLAKREYVLSFTQWITQYFSAMNFLERFKYPENGKNFSGWSHRTYLTLLEKILKQSDRNKQIDLIEQAESFLAHHMPIAPLYYFSFSYLQKSYLKNVFLSAIGRVHLEEAFFIHQCEKSVVSSNFSRSLV
jgi:oligopeptide transport system substrate-binding protein